MPKVVVVVEVVVVVLGVVVVLRPVAIRGSYSTKSGCSIVVNPLRHIFSQGFVWVVSQASSDIEQDLVGDITVMEKASFREA